MTQAERERRHQARLAQIDTVLVVAGRGDRSRPDHEATLLERARMMGEEIGSHRATERGLEAFDRLLQVLEERGNRDGQAVGEFVDALWNRRPLPLIALRVADRTLGDDMLAVLDAFRYARLDLVEHVRGGPMRLQRLLARQARLPAR